MAAHHASPSDPIPSSLRTQPQIPLLKDPQIHSIPDPNSLTTTLTISGHSPPSNPTSAAPPPNTDHPPPTQPLSTSKLHCPDLIPPPPPPDLISPPPPPLSAPLHPRRPGPTRPLQPAAPPPQLQSYAQVTRSSRGPGFVRAHANEVESFARLPRTGVNIICGSKEGIPSFSFVHSDLPKVEELYSNALVMKFHGGRPSLETSHKEIRSWGIESPFSIGPLNSRSFLIRFQDNSDLLKVLTRPSSILITFPYKIFRWHNLCHLKEESCMAPIWISLPKLPLQCFIPEFLESVANKVGRFLCFDKATSTLARPSAARMCIEIDLRKPLPQFIWVGLFDGFKQPIIYEKLPKYCTKCHCQGHMDVACSKENRAAPSAYAEERVPALHRRPPPVRPIVPMQSKLNSLGINISPMSQVQAPIPIPPPPPIINPPPASIPDFDVNQAQSQDSSIRNHTSHLPHTTNSTANGTSIPSLAQHTPKSSSIMPRPGFGACISGVCQNTAVYSSVHAVDSGNNYAIGISSNASKVCRADAMNQPPLHFPHTTPDPAAAEGTLNACQNAEGGPSASPQLTADICTAQRQPPPPLHQSAVARVIGTDLEMVDHGSASSSCNLNARVSEEKGDLIPLNSDECTSQSSNPPGFSSKNTNFKEVNLGKEDSSSQSSGPPGFTTKIPKTKKKHSSKGGIIFSHRTHLKHFATSKTSSATSKRDNPNSTPFLPINSLSPDDFDSIASNCGIKLPLSSDGFARLKALEIERSEAGR